MGPEKVERLTDYGIQGTDSDLTKKMVTSIGLKYSMMTPYTSFVAVAETIKNPQGDGTDVAQPSALPLHVSSLSVGGYTTGSEPGMLLLALGGLLGGIVFKRKREYRRGRS